nr:hypothetical protein [uncultured Carboxylicivirga sp.]
MKFKMTIKQTNRIEATDNEPLPFSGESMVSKMRKPFNQVIVDDVIISKKEYHTIDCQLPCGNEMKLKLPNMILVQHMIDGETQSYYAISEKIMSKSWQTQIGDKSFKYDVVLKPNMPYLELPKLSLMLDEDEFKEAIKPYQN